MQSRAIISVVTMRTLLAVFIAGLISGVAVAQNNPMVGVWSMQARTSQPMRPLGVMFLTVRPDGTYEEFFQLQNGQSRQWGRYQFNGNSVTGIIDGYEPSWLQPPPNFRQPVTLPVQVGEAQMMFNGEIWHRQR